MLRSRSVFGHKLGTETGTLVRVISLHHLYIHTYIHTYKLICCEFKGKQASKIESTSLFCMSHTVLHVRDQKNEWSVFVE